MPTGNKAAAVDTLHSDHVFRRLVETSLDYAIFLLNPRGEVSSWNPGAQRMKGYSSEEIVGRHFRIFYPPEAQSIRKPEYGLQVATHLGSFEDEGWRIRKNGSKFWANVVITALREPNGELIGFGKITRDLTQRREAELRYRLLVDSVTDYAIYSVDKDGYVTSWNNGAERIKQYREEEIIGQHFSKFYTQEDLAHGVPLKVLQIADEQGHYEGEGWRLRKDGSKFWSSVVITPLRDDQGTLVGFSKITRDITERKALLDLLQSRTVELENAEKVLRELSQRLLHAQDIERRRLARELHDGTGQVLVALNMNLEMLRQQATTLDPILSQRLDDSILLLGGAIREMRTTSYLLHPPMLDEVGLNAALQWLADGFQERSGIQLEIDMPPEMGRLSRDLETALFRIVQEGLTNIQRHSQSPTATVRIIEHPDEIILTVADEGQGMSDQVGQGNENKGVGIRGMRERVLQLGGTFEITTGGQGTTLKAVFPLGVESSRLANRFE